MRASSRVGPDEDDSHAEIAHRAADDGTRHARELEIIGEIGRLVSSTLDIDRVYERFAAEVQRLIPFDRVNVTLVEPGGDGYTIAYVAGVDIVGRRKGDRCPLMGSLTDAVTRTQAGFFLHPASEAEIAGLFPGSTMYQNGFRSLLSVPLISRDEAIGGLHFQALKPGAYGVQDLALAERIGNQIAGAIASAAMYASLERMAKELSVIAEIGRLVGSTPDLDRVYESFAAEVRKLIPCDRININLKNKDGVSFTIAYLSGMEGIGLAKGDRSPLAGSITGAICEAGKGQLLHPRADFSDRFPGTNTHRMGLRSMLSVPLKSRGEVIGVLHLRCRKAGAYDGRDLLLAERIAGQIAGTIANAQALAELDRLAQELSTLAEVGRLVDSTLAIDEVYERFAALVRGLIPFDLITVNLKNGDGQTFTVAYVAGIPIGAWRPGAVFPLAGSITETILRARAGLLFHPGSEEEAWNRFPCDNARISYRAGVRSIMTVPLINRDEAIGTLQFRSLQPDLYDERDLRLAERIGDQIAGAVAGSQTLVHLDRLAKEMSILAEVGRLIGSTLDLEEVYERFAEEVRTLIPFDRINVNLKNDDGQTFSVGYVAGIPIGAWRPGAVFPLAGSITADTLRTRRGRVIHANSEAEVWSLFPCDNTRISYRAGVRSIMTVPLIARDEAIGTLQFRSLRPNLYSEQDLRLAERIGDQIAGAVESAGVHANLDRLAREITVVAEIGRLVGSTLAIEEVYQKVAALVGTLVPQDWLCINLIDPGGETTTSRYVHGIDVPGRRAGTVFAIPGSLTERILRDGKGFVLHPESVDEMRAMGLNDESATTFRSGLRSIMVVPLISRDQTIGAMHFRAKRSNAYTQQDLRLAERIGGQIAGAAANARLFERLRETEASYRESEARYRSIFEQAAVGVAEMDIATGRFLTVNRRLCELLGRTEEELRATTFVAITHPDDLGLHVEGMARLAAGLIRNLSFEKRYLRKDGSVLWAGISLSPLRNPGEPLGRNSLVVQDISERHQAEERLQQTLEGLESRVRERTIELEETNTALRVLIKKGDSDQKKLEENLQANINQLVTPFLAKARTSGSEKERLTYLNILEENLNNVLSPFINRLSSAYRSLTPKEIQIAEMVKQGKQSKEIAAFFGVSVGTVITHRNNIRKKLRLKSRDANLRSHLLSLL